MWFEVDTGELARARGAVQTCAAQVATDVDALSQALEELQASWQGEAASTFGGVMTHWRVVHEQVRAGLGDVERAMELSGRAYDEAERSARGLFAD
jgi:WXG100 family type VII secretion target